MKKIFSLLIFPLIIIILFFMFISSCKNKTVTDVDGNVYHTIKIGTQVWMVENLKVTHYRNGDCIPNGRDIFIVNESLSKGAYYNYANNTKYTETYGLLYNWYAVNDSRNIAPTGWHIPSDAEWTTLTNYLGGDSVAGGKLKEKGTVHWNAPNTGANNESGFIALPSGWRCYDGSFSSVGITTHWWSSTEDIFDNVWFWFVNNDDSKLFRFHSDKNLGLSVRCIKDN